MLMVVILVCTLLIGCNAFYYTEEEKEKYRETNLNIDKNKKN